MNRPYKTATTVACSLALTITSAVPVQACGGRSARVSYGGYSQPSTYHTPVFTQPVYAPSYEHQNFSQFAPTHFTSPQLAQTQPNQARPFNPQNFQAQSIPTRSHQGQMTQPSQAFQQPSATLQTTQTQSSQLQAAAIAGQSSSQRPPQPVPQSRATSNPAQPSTNNTSAEASALSLLASIQDSPQSDSSDIAASLPSASDTPDAVSTEIPEFTAANSPRQTTGEEVGVWSVTLPGSQTVSLSLNADGTFLWLATKEGKSSSFSGQYRIENGNLTLVRANDLQQMTGSWTGSDSNFTFKIEGATNGGLNFTRS